MNYYNEWDPTAAAWLRELIKQGHLPAGDVDERSITEVKPDEIKGYTQHHFFAGIGGWSLALRMAGWADNRPVLTGSPPCQPFSLAGSQQGVADKRHLAPVWLSLVAALRSPVVFGEQVAAAVTKDNWLDDLLNAMEAEGYATGAIVLPACGIGAPHIRQRLWIAARLADTKHDGHTPSQDRRSTGAQQTEGRMQQSARACPVGGLADADNQRHDRVNALLRPETSGRNTTDLRQTAGGSYESRTDATHGGWNDAEWLFCRDGKWRPVEPGTFPLADGIPSRVGRLRGYGNAIVPQVAVQIIHEIMRQST
jgi:DNA (cytosine-5)-methyltransferase 1